MKRSSIFLIGILAVVVLLFVLSYYDNESNLLAPPRCECSVDIDNPPCPKGTKPQIMALSFCDPNPSCGNEGQGCSSVYNCVDNLGTTVPNPQGPLSEVVIPPALVDLDKNSLFTVSGICQLKS